jgi:hypothetical protein
LLDIFDAYRLYGDVGNENGCVRHTLRLGFFKDTATAAAVAMYLASYFDGPRVIEPTGRPQRQLSCSSPYQLRRSTDWDCASTVTHVTFIRPRSCEHIPSIDVGTDMKRSQSRFTLIEATALIAIMALVVISVTPRFKARQLTANICSFPDSRHHAECLGTGKDRQVAKNR